MPREVRVAEYMHCGPSTFYRILFLDPIVSMKSCIDNVSAGSKALQERLYPGSWNNHVETPGGRNYGFVTRHQQSFSQGLKAFCIDVGVHMPSVANKKDGNFSTSEDIGCRVFFLIARVQACEASVLGASAVADEDFDVSVSLKYRQ